MSCSVISGPDFGFNVLRIDVILQPGWLILGIFTLYLFGFKLISVMISPSSTFLEVLDLQL